MTLARGEPLPDEGGTYVLVLGCGKACAVEVGRLGPLHTTPGYYLYVGSAFGPGGLAARVRRHVRVGKRLHWHVDYLRAETTLEVVWFVKALRLEHRWAAALAASPRLQPVPGFGASDCRCPTHLFHTRRRPQLASFERTAGLEVAAWRPPAG